MRRVSSSASGSGRRAGGAATGAGPDATVWGTSRRVPSGSTTTCRTSEAGTVAGQYTPNALSEP